MDLMISYLLFSPVQAALPDVLNGWFLVAGGGDDVRPVLGGDQV